MQVFERTFSCPTEHFDPFSSLRTFSQEFGGEKLADLAHRHLKEGKQDLNGEFQLQPIFGSRLQVLSSYEKGAHLVFGVEGGQGFLFSYRPNGRSEAVSCFVVGFSIKPSILRTRDPDYPGSYPVIMQYQGCTDPIKDNGARRKIVLEFFNRYDWKSLAVDMVKEWAKGKFPMISIAPSEVNRSIADGFSPERARKLYDEYPQEKGFVREAGLWVYHFENVSVQTQSSEPVAAAS